MTTIDLETNVDAASASATRVPGSVSAAATMDRRVNHELAAVPICSSCKTDTYLYIEQFTPAMIDLS